MLHAGNFFELLSCMLGKNEIKRNEKRKNNAEDTNRIRYYPKMLLKLIYRAKTYEKKHTICFLKANKSL